MISDVHAMLRAVELSRRGYPAPNPHVGCVIVRDGVIVGEGFHDHAGGPHAEIVALAQAGERARGAHAFVTLEPCNHLGRTGPCSEALIAAGVAKVSAATLDPNPKARGGLNRLAEAGLTTDVGLCQSEAFASNARWLTAMRMQRPYVTLKAAVSLDGRIALPNGESKWITGELARAEGHRLRALHGAVLVGRRTVEADDPILTARIEDVRNQPTRIVLDLDSKLARTFRVFNDEAPTLHVTRSWLEGRPLAAALWDCGITSVLVEGGATTHARMLEEDLADAIELFVAPQVLGAGPSWVQGLSIHSIAEAARFRIVSTQRFGDDLSISLERNRSSPVSS